MRTKYYTPMCSCGCGEFVTIGWDGNWNKWLPGHNLRSPLSVEKETERVRKIKSTLKQRFEDPELRKRISEQATGRHHTEETKQLLSKLRSGAGNGMYGKSVSQEVKDKLSKRFKGRVLSEEHKRKLSESSKGRIISQEQKDRISKTLKEYFKINPNPFAGKTHTTATKRKLRIKNLNKYDGPKHPQWQGGISNLPYAFEWPEISLKIRTRDNNICQNPTCEQRDTRMTVHHIDYNKLNNQEHNLITLCSSCNCKANFNRKEHHKFYSALMVRLLRR